eukprot:13683560-Ditylum_brightwellii.AAC.1
MGLVGGWVATGWHCDCCKKDVIPPLPFFCHDVGNTTLFLQTSTHQQQVQRQFKRLQEQALGPDAQAHVECCKQFQHASAVPHLI